MRYIFFKNNFKKLFYNKVTEKNHFSQVNIFLKLNEFVFSKIFMYIYKLLSQMFAKHALYKRFIFDINICDPKNIVASRHRDLIQH